MIILNRISSAYENKSFQYNLGLADLKKNCFQDQFYFLYRARIDMLFDRILENAKKIIDAKIQITQLADATRLKEYFVVGVILKKMKYRRSVLYDFQDEETLDFDFREKLKSDCLTSDEDFLEFEGDQQVVKLVGDIDKDQFVTGTVVGLYGYVTNEDYFHVKKVIFPMLPDQIPHPIIEKDCYVAFLSGVALNSDIAANARVLYALDKLINWLCAEIWLSDKELNIVQNINRLIFAGESIQVTNQDVKTQQIEFLGFDKEIDKDAIDIFDNLLSRLVNSINVDVMSGYNDPTSILLPQLPIPRLVFPNARRFGKMLNTVTNPYKFQLNGFTFLGTAGQNIQDLSKLTVGFSTLDLMQECLIRGHLFPTVPDSLDGYSLQKQDPLVVDELPHVFFCGNQKYLETKTAEFSEKSALHKTLLLSIPKFKNNFTLTLVNLKNMQVSEYDFLQENDI